MQWKKKWFTLLELLLVVVISGTLITTIYSVMVTLPRVKVFNDARQKLIQETNEVMNRFAVLFQDYTIDYEEYYNRQMHGCTAQGEKWNNFLWTGKYLTQTGHCEYFTAYGNEAFWKNTITRDLSHWIKYCSSSVSDGPYYQMDKCQNNTNIEKGKQGYGQYKALFWDVGGDTDGKTKINALQWTADNENFNAIGDADDRDLGTGPIALRDAKNVKELYLISHDGQRRLFLRLFRTTKNGYPLSTIQILRLRGFDAGSQHTFKIGEDSKTYDGEIDTRACDYGAWFICQPRIPVSRDLYPGYTIPQNKDDGWVNLLDENISIANWNIEISPVKNPEYARAENDMQINPFIKISLSTNLSPHLWNKKLGGMLSGYTYSIQSSFDTRWFYLK